MTYIPAGIGVAVGDISVRASDGNQDPVTLATEVENGDAFDNITLATGDVILLTKQFTASENGLWVVAASGAPSRPTTFDTGAAASGVSVYVEEGATATRRYVCVNPIASDTIDTDDLVFVREPRVHNKAVNPISAPSDPVNGIFPGDIWRFGNVDESRAWINAGLDAGSSVWKQLGDGRNFTIAGTARTIVQDDINDTLFFSNAGTITITANSISLGTVVLVQQGAGQVRVTAGTATRRVAATFNPHTAEQFSVMTLLFRGTEVFVFGDLEAV